MLLHLPTSVTHYHVERMAEPNEHENIVKEIRSLRSQVRKSHQQLEPFVKALSEMIFGISIDNIVNSAKDEFMSDTRQH